MIGECKTCQGYGLWAFGDQTPMFRMDAEDGYPTVPCPECGANQNPTKEPVPSREEQARQSGAAFDELMNHLKKLKEI